MVVEIGTFSRGSTGNATILLNNETLTPTSLRLRVCQKYNTSDTVVHLSDGFTDGTDQQFVSVFGDATSHQSKSGTNKVISFYARVSGVLTEIIAATFVSWDAGEFTLNFSAANANYQIQIEVMD